MSYAFYGFLLGLSALPARAQAQSGGDGAAPDPLTVVEVPAPEAYAALKMEDYGSVSNSGSGNLSTELFSLSAEGQSLPVSLSYSLGGVRASEIASHVGLGWNLSIGASLTRIVHGEPDEAPEGYLRESRRTTAMALYVQCQDQVQYACDALDQNMQAYDDALSQGYDLGPDAFKYTVGGISGQFRLDAEGRIRYQPVTNVRITYAKDLSWIEITDPDGKIWRFGSDAGLLARPVDVLGLGQPINGDNQTTRNPTRQTKWNLTSVSDATGREVFAVTYVPSAFSTESEVPCTESQSTYQCIGINTKTTTCAEQSAKPSAGTLTDETTGTIYRTDDQLTWLPSKISNPLTERSISFGYASDREDVGQSLNPATSFGPAKRLTSVSYDDGDQVLTKRLEQVYASAKDADAYYERKLILTAIEARGADGEVYNRESFTYDMPRAAATRRTPGLRRSLTPGATSTP